jgi:hypothetical protein
MASNDGQNIKTNYVLRNYELNTSLKVDAY